ncbi:tRNA-specific adenosine deaminase 1 isoform X1 [Hermetia illucens]|nr:tRNA-specific adenosine deaminase 1 isoform X1 [Hermetia illucens]
MMETTSFVPADQIFKLCIEKFNSLPRTGKPTTNEWTVLSCIIQCDSNSKNAKVISLGTGTKCIGSDQLCEKGLILNDSHAEVMARRGFLRYLYASIRNYLSDGSPLAYNEQTGKYSIKNGISFHFFSTHAPCGDATIVSKSTGDEEIEPGTKKMKLSPEFTDNFTGAKLIAANENTDLMSQDEGAIRTKPGRGIRTLSVSCSDKLSRWNILGIQGALINIFLDKPVYFETLTFSGQVSEISVKRALYGRWRKVSFNSERYKLQMPRINICSPDLKFEFEQTTETDPSPASIVWADVQEKPLEVAVSGKRQGVTKSKRNTISGALRISKVWLFHEFVSTLSSQPSLQKSFYPNSDDFHKITYKEAKFCSEEYQSAWNLLKTDYFQNWTKKSEKLLDFKLEDR